MGGKTGFPLRGGLGATPTALWPQLHVPQGGQGHRKDPRQPTALVPLNGT